VKKSVGFKWNDEQDKNFNLLKDNLYIRMKEGDEWKAAFKTKHFFLVS